MGGKNHVLFSREIIRGRKITHEVFFPFIFSAFTLYGCGAEPVLYGLMMLVLGIPVYVWQRRRSANVRSKSLTI